MELTIEKYNNHSVERLIQIDTEAASVFIDCLDKTYSQDDFYHIDQVYADGEFFVALKGNEIIGTCAYLMRDENTAELKRFRIKGSEQHKGYGGMLLGYIEDVLKSKGIKRIILNTASVREHTIEFYQKKGYTQYDKKEYGSIYLLYFEKYVLP